MKRVFVCSPLRAITQLDMECNIMKARLYCRAVANLGHLPLAPHVYFTQFLDDRLDSHREMGLDMGLELLKDCDEIWVFGEKITSGMEKEIKFAERLKIPVVQRSATL